MSLSRFHLPLFLQAAAAGEGVASFAGVAAFSATGASTAAATFSFGGTASFAFVGEGLGAGGSVASFAGVADFTGVGAATAEVAGSFAGVAAFGGVGANATPPAIVDDGGAGDGALGREWAKARPLRPKARGIPREWIEEAAPAVPVPAEWKAPTPRLERTGTLGDLAAIELMRPPAGPRVPRAWETEEEEDVELLLLA